MKTTLLTLVVLLVIVLRHDYWWWDKTEPLLFGFLPVGLWWQAIVTLMAAGMMWMLVRFAWPADLEEEGKETADERR